MNPSPEPRNPALSPSKMLRDIEEIEATLNKELRIKSRKISKLQMQMKELKDFVLYLQKTFDLPPEAEAAIKEVRDKFGFA